MNKEIRPLTSLRFLAACYVFLFHIHIRWPLAAKDTKWDKLFAIGAIGMTLFFIISGFVLANRYMGLNKSESLGKYFFNRFTRIYPVYFLVAVLTIPWLISTVCAIEGNQTKHIMMLVVLGITNLLLIQAWFPQLFQYWNDGGSWSISAEAFFYALFPFVAPWFANTSISRLWVGLGLFYFMALLPGLTFVLFPSSFQSIVIYATPIFRVAEFLVGVAAGALFARGVRAPFPGVLTLVGLIGIVLYTRYGPGFGFIFVANNWAVVPLFTLVVFAAACLRSGPINWIASLSPIVYLGRISYSFYSFQLLALLWLIGNHKVLVTHFQLLNNNIILAVVTFSIISIAAAFSHHLLEAKLRVFLNKKFLQREEQKMNLAALHPLK